MRLHKNIVQAVVDGLTEIFGKQAHADHVVKKQIKSDRRWGSRDRKFIAESLYNIVRWWRWYMVIADIDELDEERFSKVLGVYLQEKGVEFPEWFSPEIPTLEELNVLKAKYSNETKIVASIPDWLDDLGRKELGEQWQKEISALNEEADVVLRVNTLKIEKSKLIRLLKKEGVEVAVLADFPDALVLNKRRDLSQLKTFKNGFFEIQDASSQLVAPFTKVKEAMTVIDACAGAGGKSLHMAAQMENKGKIFSLDIEDLKLEALEIRSNRAGSRIVSAHHINNQQIRKLTDRADVLLIDAPCSGLGVLRRKPDTKWKLSEEKIEEYRVLQRQILNDYHIMLKPGGILVYVTCSILPSENEAQIAQFLANHSEAYTLEEERKVMPSEGFDGFYMARLRKIDQD